MKYPIIMLVYQYRKAMTAHTYIIVPAAGGGTRMQQPIPKQYLNLAGKPVLEHTLTTLLAIPFIARVVVALSSDDLFFNSLASATHPRLTQVQGGNSRASSVLNALNALSTIAEPHDWVLVHDAARPLVTLKDIDHLRVTLANHPIGGILATPVTDTLKQSDAQLKTCLTVARDTLWRALTPQMCRYGLLKQALSHCLNANLGITDEAMALETLGQTMQIVEGSADNIKITYPIDLLIAEQLLLTR